MVKSYLRYEPSASFGVITSLESNIAHDHTGAHLLSPALEKVAVWHVRQGTSLKTLIPSSSSSARAPAVSAIASSSSSPSLASGYSDGSIRVWNIDNGGCDTSFNGHKVAVTALRFDATGGLLASGSKDNDVILWDVVGETGRFRLRGHRDQITDIVFVKSDSCLVSSSKDKFIRVWDLETQQCLQIVSGHRSEIWSLDVNHHGNFLVSGSSDREIRVFQINIESRDVLTLFGDIQRQGKERVGGLRFNKEGNLLASNSGKTLEIYHVLEEDEAKKKAKRRINRKKEKISETDAETRTIAVGDYFKLANTIRASKKISSFSISPKRPKNSLASIALSLNNNLLEFYNVNSENAVKTSSIEFQGHRSDVRSVTLSPDNTLLMSTSHNSVKIWNPSSCSCLRTIDSGYGLCGLILAPNKYALVGTKEGKIEVIDINGGSCVEKIEAHGGSLDAIAQIPDGNTFVTGGADKDIKFWEFGGETVSHLRTLKMNDDVLAVAVSPDSKYIAVALLDNTVKVYFLDTLKFFLSLYGHNQPVLCMDISSDGEMIATGSMDKNMKIWGMDFGDCHKSLFAHSESITALKFVRNTHYVFTAGKDRMVKYWDADKFELLLTLEGHHDAVWCLAVSSVGDFVVSGSHDRSIRRWDRTDEPFFLQEEKEKRIEEMLEGDFESIERFDLPQEGGAPVGGKSTRESVSATDAIINALDDAEFEFKRLEEKTSGKTVNPANPIMRGMSPSDYVLHVLSTIHTNNVEHALLALPFSDALKLLQHMKKWGRHYDKIELLCRVAMFIVQIHYQQLISSHLARCALSDLHGVLYPVVKECKDAIGFNLAAMEHLTQMMVAKSDAPFKDAKAKLVEIREKIAKRAEGNTESKIEKKKKKKQKKAEDGHFHAWS